LKVKRRLIETLARSMAPSTVGKPFRPDDVLCGRDLAVLGLSDELIMAETGHTSRAMVVR